MAQWLTTPTNSVNIYNSNTGFVGIGTNNPTFPLQVNGTLRVLINNATGDNANLYLSNSNAANTTNDPRGMIWLDNDGRVKIRSVTGYGFAFRNTQNTSDIMSVADAGVSIGTLNTNGYMLAVNGGIHAKKVNIDLTGWPDYVFNQTYSLPLLNDVKYYIDKNHHLPEMPSAQEIEKNGLDVGEMNRLLMKKVEELTLYLLNSNKKINKQQESLNEQLKINKNQEKRMKKIEELLRRFTK